MLHLRLLIVDDNPTNRRILELYAKNWGVRCLLAENGPEALAQLRAMATQMHTTLDTVPEQWKTDTAHAVVAS